MIRLAILLAAASVASAGDCCFCPDYAPPAPYYVAPPAEYENVQVDIITRQIAMSKQKPPKKDLLLEYALKKQWEELTSAIPIPAAPRNLRAFKFANNWPTVPAQQRRRSTSTVQTQTVTRILTGVVSQNVVVQGGVVALDVPPAVIDALTR